MVDKSSASRLLMLRKQAEIRANNAFLRRNIVSYYNIIPVALWTWWFHRQFRALLQSFVRLKDVSPLQLVSVTIKVMFILRRPTGRGDSKGWPGDHAPLWELAVPCTPCLPQMKLVASHSWCQITPFTQFCVISSGILAKYRSGYPAGHPRLLQLETPLPIQGIVSVVSSSTKVGHILASRLNKRIV